MEKMWKRKIRLPISVTEYNQLVKLLCSKYGFEDPEYVSSVISVVIRRLDNETAHTTLEFLANNVFKHMANTVAQHQGDMIRGRVQVDNMVTMFKTDSNNQQILDELQRMADNGFEYAKIELQKLLDAAKPLEAPVSHLNLVDGQTAT